MRLSLAILSILWIVSPSSDTYASHESIYEILQPIEVAGINVVGLTTYILYGINFRDPNSKIVMTTRANTIDCGLRVENRNKANRLRIRFLRDSTYTSEKAGETFWGVSGDTSWIIVDMNDVAIPQHDIYWRQLEHTLSLALYCGLRNAFGSFKEVNHVNYRIDGFDELEHWSGTYSLEGIDPTPTYRSRTSGEFRPASEP